MSESTLDQAAGAASGAPDWGEIGMLVVRYGIGATMILGGVVVLIVSPAGLGVDGFAMAAGGGLSLLLLGFMYRLSVRSERDRVEEARARQYSMNMASGLKTGSAVPDAGGFSRPAS